MARIAVDTLFRFSARETRRDSRIFGSSLQNIIPSPKVSLQYRTTKRQSDLGLFWKKSSTEYFQVLTNQFLLAVFIGSFDFFKLIDDI